MTGQAVSTYARLMTAARAIWQGIGPVPHQRISLANHCSNADFVLLWSALPTPHRHRTRPVAALDCWLTSPLRAFIGREVFNAHLIDRRSGTRADDPEVPMVAALDEGSFLILFAEGQRNSFEVISSPGMAGSSTGSTA